MALRIVKGETGSFAEVISDAGWRRTCGESMIVFSPERSAGYHPETLGASGDALPGPDANGPTIGMFAAPGFRAILQERVVVITSWSRKVTNSCIGRSRTPPHASHLAGRTRGGADSAPKRQSLRDHRTPGECIRLPEGSCPRPGRDSTQLPEVTHFPGSSSSSLSRENFRPSAVSVQSRSRTFALQHNALVLQVRLPVAPRITIYSRVPQEASNACRALRSTGFTIW